VVALRSRVIFGAVDPAEEGTPEDYFVLPLFFDRNNLNTHRGCFLAIAATDRFGNINLIDNATFFGWQFSDELSHRPRFSAHTKHSM